VIRSGRNILSCGRITSGHLSILWDKETHCRAMMMFLGIFENSYVGWAVPNRFSALQILLSASSIANDMQYSHCGKLIANKLFAEEQQRLERQPKSTSCSTPFPPINITNVSPPSSHQSPMASQPIQQ
jgi:hypothetical protein